MKSRINIISSIVVIALSLVIGGYIFLAYLNSPKDSNLIYLRAQIRQCFIDDGFSNKCLDDFFQEYMANRSTNEVLLNINELTSYDEDINIDCHVVIHPIGRQTLLKKKTVDHAFKECDKTCQSACYHGVMEQFMINKGYSNISDFHKVNFSLFIKDVCNTNDSHLLRFQCLHGLGHGLLYMLDYNLSNALEICDNAATEWDASSCYTGVFMENMVGEKDKRNLKKDDLHYPCNTLDDKYKDQCYLIHTSWLDELDLSEEEIIEECKKAVNYSGSCVQSLGRDLGNEVRDGDSSYVAKLCSSLEPELKQRCMSGVLYALIDFTWDGSYAYKFCSIFRSKNDKSLCFNMSSFYLTYTILRPINDLQNDCRLYARNIPECANSIKLEN